MTNCVTFWRATNAVMLACADQSIAANRQVVAPTQRRAESRRVAEENQRRRGVAVRVGPAIDPEISCRIGAAAARGVVRRVARVNRAVIGHRNSDQPNPEFSDVALNAIGLECVKQRSIRRIQNINHKVGCSAA